MNGVRSASWSHRTVTGVLLDSFLGHFLALAWAANAAIDAAIVAQRKASRIWCNVHWYAFAHRREA